MLGSRGFRCCDKRTTERPVHDGLLKDSCLDRVFPVAIEPARPHVTTKVLVSRYRVGLGWRGTLHSARATECSVRALCTPQTCDSALCYALFGSLFMDIVHEHCKWALLKKKKSTKITPENLGCHRNGLHRWIRLAKSSYLENFRQIPR